MSSMSKKTTTAPSKPEVKPEVKKQAVSDDFYDADIQVLVGEAGTGKSFFAMHHPNMKEGIYLDLEDRYRKQLKHHPEIDLRECPKKTDGDYDLEKLTLGMFVVCLKYDKTGDNDYIKTFETTENITYFVLKKFVGKIKLLVFDSVEDLRMMAKDKYEEEKRIAKKGDYTAYGVQAWGNINNMVRKIIYRSFNHAKIYGLKVIMTCHFEPVYENEKLTNRVKVPLKPFIMNRVDEVLGFYRNGKSFSVIRGKSPKGPSDRMNWTIGEDIVAEEEENNGESESDE